MNRKQLIAKGWYFSKAMGWKFSGRRRFVYEAWIEDGSKTKSGRNYFYADSPKFILQIANEQTI